MMPDYFQFAAAEVRKHAHQLRAEGDAAPYTVVERRIGSSSHARCYADVFEPGVLTVSSADDPSIQSTYQPGTWEFAHVYGSDGHLLYSLRSSVPLDPIARPCEFCAQPALFTGRRADGVESYECRNAHVQLVVPGASTRRTA